MPGVRWYSHLYLTGDYKMAIPVYLWLTDYSGNQVKGSVDIQGREGSIEIVEFMHSVDLPIDNLTGKITGKRIHGDFALIKEIDSSSSYLYQSVSTGDKFKQAELKFAGRPGFKNDSAQECVKNKGPLPRGTYTIGSAFYHPKTKAWTMRLTPYAGIDMCGRDGFMIHGESSAHPGEASDGCIILNISSRKIIAASTDKILVVED